jgi:hypothetical protein
MRISIALRLSLLSLLLAGCPDSGGVDSDDDDAATDDDDNADDDDATVDDQAPSIVGLEVCQVTFSGNSFGLFNIDVLDPDGDMTAPVGYRLQIGSAALDTYAWDETLGEAGTIAHTEQIGQSDLPRGSTHEFRFSVRDSANHWSPEEVLVWTIPTAAELDPC